MNLEFSAESLEIRDQGRRFLAGQTCLPKVRAALDGGGIDNAALWQGIVAQGWTGAAIPEEYGGHGIGYEALCVIAEELGRSLAPVPFASTAFLAAEALMLAGSEDGIRPKPGRPSAMSDTWTMRATSTSPTARAS